MLGRAKRKIKLQKMKLNVAWDLNFRLKRSCHLDFWCIIENIGKSPKINLAIINICGGPSPHGLLSRYRSD